MITTAEHLVDFWQAARGAYVHPEDSDAMRARRGFETALHPVPWSGPLSTARAYLLYLNPGLAPSDIGYEKSRPDFVRTLEQNLLGTEKYIYLQDRFSDHAGAKWANRVFGPDISRHEFSQMCFLQLVPYHSEKGDIARAIAPKLASSMLIKSFVNSNVLPRARRGEVALIVARSSKLWEVPDDIDSPNIVVHKGWQTRRASQRENSVGGKLLRRFIRGEDL